MTLSSTHSEALQVAGLGGMAFAAFPKCTVTEPW